MDPFSIVVGTLTLLHGARKSADAIIALHKAPVELQALTLQMLETTSLLDDIRHFPANDKTAAILESRVQRASTVTRKISIVMTECVVGAKVDRVAWLRAKSKIKRLTVELTEAKNCLAWGLRLLMCISASQVESKFEKLVAGIDRWTLQESGPQISNGDANVIAELSNTPNLDLPSGSSSKSDGGIDCYQSHSLNVSPNNDPNQLLQDPLAQVTALSLGSPMNSMEVLSTYYPEQYMNSSCPMKAYYMHSKSRVLSFKVGSFHKIGVLHAETPRRWRRITISFELNLTASELKKIVKHILSTDVEFETTVTNITLLSDSVMTQALDCLRFSVTEDRDEAQHDLAGKFVPQLEDYGCPTFVEDDVVTLSPISSNSFNVFANGKRCIEKKLPFALTADNTFSFFYEGFFHNIKALHALQGSLGVVGLVGVVVDRKRTQVKSYLYENAEYGTIGNLISAAIRKGEVISWEMREQWARKMIEGLVDIHAKGFVIGRLGLWSVVLDQGGAVRRKNIDGNVCLPGRGWAAPELRNRPVGAPKFWSRDDMTTKTDLFQLGLELWQLAEHVPGYRTSVSQKCCAAAKCKYIWEVGKPACPEPHADPVILPRCDSSIPAFYQNIIDICRSEDPSDRMPARKLLQLFVPTGKQVNRDSLPVKFELWPIGHGSAPNVITPQTTWWHSRATATSVDYKLVA